MCSVSSSNPIIKTAASSTILPDQPTPPPLTATVTNAQEVAYPIILPGIPISETERGIVPMSSPIPASSRSITTPRPNLYIRTISRSIDRFDSIEELPKGVYEGQRNKEGKPHGRGKLTFPNGDIYEGQFVNGEYHGEGTFTFSNKDFYEGPFANGCFSGKGKLTFYSKKQVYEGQFLDGVFNGTGKITTFDEEVVYEGQFLNNVFSGHGMLNLSNGDIYTGSFKGGVFHGEGMVTTTEGEIFEGIFRNGKIQKDNVTITFSTGIVYQGPITDYKPNGFGRLTHPNGNIYEGIFENGKILENNVKIIFRNGKRKGVVYQGQIKNYMANGIGRETDPDGGYFQGNFKDGKADGMMTLYHPHSHYSTKIEYKDGKQVKSKSCIIL